MDPRETSQVLRSVTHLTKESDNDVTGAVAEAFSGNATPSISQQRSRFFANFRTNSSTSNRRESATEAPPTYQSDRPEARRGSEGSVVSHIDLPRQDDATSSQRSSRRPSYFSSTGNSSSASVSVLSSGFTSASTSPDAQPSLAKQHKSQRKSSNHFGTAARQALRSPPTFLGLPDGISEGGLSNGAADAPRIASDGTDATSQIADHEPCRGNVSSQAAGVAGEAPNGSTSATNGNHNKDYFSADTNAAVGDGGGSGPDATVTAAAAAEAAKQSSHAAASSGSADAGSVALASNSSLATANGSSPIGKADPNSLAGRRRAEIPNSNEFAAGLLRAESPASMDSNFLESDHPSRVLGQKQQHQSESPSADSASAPTAPVAAVSASAIAASASAFAISQHAASHAAAAETQNVCNAAVPSTSSHLSSAAQADTQSLPLCSSVSRVVSRPDFRVQAPAESMAPSDLSHHAKEQEQDEVSTSSLVVSAMPAAYSTAPSTPLSSALSSVTALDVATPHPTPSHHTRPPPSSSGTSRSTSSLLSLSSSSSRADASSSLLSPSCLTTTTTTTSANVANTTDSVATCSSFSTAATSSSPKASNKALPEPPSSSTALLPAPLENVPSASVTSSSSRNASVHPTEHLNNSVSTNHAAILRIDPHTSQQRSRDDRNQLPLTPPDSSGPCLSPHSSVSGVSGSQARVDNCFGIESSAAVKQRKHDLPSPASSARGSVSSHIGRRGSSIDAVLSPLTPANQSILVRSPPASTTSPTNTGRVSFDLRRVSVFGGTSTATRMSPDTTRISHAGASMAKAPTATDINGARTSSGPSSKFFSRISLSGGSRRDSGNESPLSTPGPKPRSRFASLGRLGRSSDAHASPNGAPDLRKSMQPWASASTDVFDTTTGRNSLTLAREEATRPRKSLHLPRSNLIDMDSEASPDAPASASSAMHDLDHSTLPPIATPTTQTESSAHNAGRRPSFNFLRRTSANSTNQTADNTSGERRASFARNFMNRTLSRSSKTDTSQTDLARSIQTPHGEVETPTFRNSMFDSQPPVSTGNATYPGLSPTVNWNASSDSRNPRPAEVAPGDVDPVMIPAYPTPATSNAILQPKGVSDSSSEVLAQRRTSAGIDEEQDAVEAGDTVPNSLPRSGQPTALASRPSATQGTDSRAPRNRPPRLNNALSHLPRLDSMHTISSVAGNTPANVNGAPNGSTVPGSATDGPSAGETSEEEQEVSEDEDESDLTGHTSDYHDLETETDDETDDDNSPTASRHVSTAPLAPPMAATGSGGISRNRPTESLILPPAPSFIPNTASSYGAHGTNADASSASGAKPSNGEYSQNIGRNTWTSFQASGFTPFETPTPSFGGGAFTSGLAGPTPRARQELSESSYFAARPGSSNNGRATMAGTMTGDVPPPSPSIISRSRAPSSASMRTIRTPGAGALASGPLPNRSMPVAVPPLTALALNRQISNANKAGLERSKSPVLATVGSRPSTSGTLTPHQTQAGPSSERGASREPSIDRPTSERPSSRLETTAEGTSNRQLNGLDGSAFSQPRPNFYQQKSKSLIDLLGPASRRLETTDVALARPPVINEQAASEVLRTPTTPCAPLEAPAYSKKDRLAPITTGLSAQAPLASPGGLGLGRRRSMFEMRAEPPPYTIIHIRPEGPQIILPREEEGKEKLPGYCCGVHIEGYLPRKMEFSAPGVQAKDRSWKRQYFVLHGTSLRVYKNDLSVDRHAANGVWGEMKGVHVHLEPMNEDGSNGSGPGIGLGAAAREAISHTPLGHHRNDSKQKDGGTEFDNKNGLIRNYTLQGAESGLAADYLKRRHVVRVRAEGEQFLLQTRSDRHVVDWIEALQAATNVSLDLEKRPMPKFITLPRRRRRRRRNPDGTGMTAEEQEARDLAEAQRRSMADAGSRGIAGAEATPRASSISASGRPSMSVENEAFERMLREDQEEGGRQSAAVM